MLRTALGPAIQGIWNVQHAKCLTMLRPTKGMHVTPLRRRRSPALRFGQASDGGSEGMAWPDPMIDFAELDAQN